MSVVLAFRLSFLVPDFAPDLEKIGWFLLNGLLYPDRETSVRKDIIF